MCLLFNLSLIHLIGISDLAGQIDYNQRLRQQAYERDEQEYRLGMQAEYEYQQRLKSCLDNPEIDRPHPMRRAVRKLVV
jgi:hypothetical protein